MNWRYKIQHTLKVREKRVFCGLKGMYLQEEKRDREYNMGGWLGSGKKSGRTSGKRRCQGVGDESDGRRFTDETRGP
jgi:hypothetical protein